MIVKVTANNVFAIQLLSIVSRDQFMRSVIMQNQQKIHSSQQVCLLRVFNSNDEQYTSC